MSGSGMLCHEGSSPPQSKPAQPRPIDSSLVLDIAGLAAVSDNRWVLTERLRRRVRESSGSGPRTRNHPVAVALYGEVKVTRVNWTPSVCRLCPPDSLEPLMLRRPDSRRSTTQTWYFSSGKLTCGLSRLVVQVAAPAARQHQSAAGAASSCMTACVV